MYRRLKHKRWREQRRKENGEGVTVDTGLLIDFSINTNFMTDKQSIKTQAARKIKIT